MQQGAGGALCLSYLMLNTSVYEHASIFQRFVFYYSYHHHHH